MILAAFADERALTRAAARLRAEGTGSVETYTPVEPRQDPDQDPAEDAAVSWIPLAVLVVGVLAAVGMFLLQTYATVVSYPTDVGGRPDYSWPAYVPNAFEMGALAAVAAGFFGFLLACRMPRLHEPIDESDAFREATRDGWFLAVRGADPERVRELLAGLGPRRVEELPG